MSIPPFALASNAESLGRGLNPTATFANFGLTTRFTVRFIDSSGIDALGDWSSCRGLGIDFQTEQIQDGGAQRRRPTHVFYPRVTLERAVQRDSTRMLQAWLAKVVTAWREKAVQPTGTVDITLYDVQGGPVATWSLLNAYPVSWAGPALDARTNSFALESLTLEHEGFLPPSTL